MEDCKLKKILDALYKRESKRILIKIKLLETEVKDMGLADQTFHDLLRFHRVVLRSLQIKIAALALIGGFIAFLIERIIFYKVL